MAVYETNDFKFIAGILYTKISESGSCGAVILSNNKIVTCAHCVYDTFSVTFLLATVNTDEPYYALNVLRDEMFLHPEFNKKSPYKNDIAVIILKKPIKFGSKVGKIDMVPVSYVIKPGEELQILGYSESQGSLYQQTYFDTHLRLMNATMSDFDACNDIYSNTDKLEKAKQFCVMLNNDNQQFRGGIRSLLIATTIF